MASETGLHAFHRVHLTWRDNPPVVLNLKFPTCGRANLQEVDPLKLCPPAEPGVLPRGCSSGCWGILQVRNVSPSHKRLYTPDCFSVILFLTNHFFGLSSIYLRLLFRVGQLTFFDRVQRQKTSTGYWKRVREWITI